MKRQPAFLIATALLLSARAVAQNAPARLTVQSIPSGAEVYINARFVGNTPLTELPVEPGKVILRIVYPDARAWNAIQKVDSLILHEGQSSLYEADLGVALTLVSVPSGATVIGGNQELGTTPLFWRGTIAHDLEVRKQGYEPERIPRSQLLNGVPLIRLRPHGIDATQQEVLSPAPANGLTNPIPVYVSAGAFILSGIVAAALKERADKEFEIYQRTLEPERRRHTERLDRQSGAAFAVMQVSFAALAYLLLVE